ncbi:hypothetical protein THAOC_24203, partial [Thalassiosira oceanica]
MQQTGIARARAARPRTAEESVQARQQTASIRNRQRRTVAAAVKMEGMWGARRRNMGGMP